MMPVKMNIKTNRNAHDQPKPSNWNVYYCLLPCTQVSLQITKMRGYRELPQVGILFLNQGKSSKVTGQIGFKKSLVTDYTLFHNNCAWHTPSQKSNIIIPIY